jgi:hypothetical protein
VDIEYFSLPEEKTTVSTNPVAIAAIMLAWRDKRRCKLRIESTGTTTAYVAAPVSGFTAASSNCAR